MIMVEPVDNIYRGQRLKLGDDAYELDYLYELSQPPGFMGRVIGVRDGEVLIDIGVKEPHHGHVDADGERRIEKLNPKRKVIEVSWRGNEFTARWVKDFFMTDAMLHPPGTGCSAEGAVRHLLSMCCNFQNVPMPDDLPAFKVLFNPEHTYQIVVRQLNDSWWMAMVQGREEDEHAYGDNPTIAMRGLCKVLPVNMKFNGSPIVLPDTNAAYSVPDSEPAESQIQTVTPLAPASLMKQSECTRQARARRSVSI